MDPNIFNTKVTILTVKEFLYFYCYSTNLVFVPTYLYPTSTQKDEKSYTLFYKYPMIPLVTIIRSVFER
jgi:hypothetical protein